MNAVIEIESNDPNYLIQRMFKSLDSVLIVALLMLGWNYEWVFLGRGNWPPPILYYTTTFAPALYFILYYVVRHHIQKTYHTTFPQATDFLKLILVFFVIAVLERAVNEFENTLIHWKENYFLILLPFWGLIGFDIGASRDRAEKFIHELARLGGVAVCISLILQFIGDGPESPLGPMHHPYRFIAIFGFFFYLTSQVTGIRRSRSTKYWLLICSIAVFQDVYKFTIVSTLFGFVAWTIYLSSKSKDFKKKNLYSLVIIIIGAVIVVYIIDALSGGTVLRFVSYRIEKLWLKNITTLDLRSINALSGSRFVMWAQLIPRIEAHPIIGSGMGQVHHGNIVTHNGYLDLLLSYGISGIGIFIAGVYRWQRAIRKSMPSDVDLLLILTAVGFIVTILAANLFGSVWILFHTVTAYVMLVGGITYRLCMRTDSK